MRDLRAMGATNALVERSRRPLRRDGAVRAAAVYAERFADADGRIRATFDIISLSGWAPHESQQKPLRPGSATARLADALGTVGAIGGGEGRSGPEAAYSVRSTRWRSLSIGRDLGRSPSCRAETPPRMIGADADDGDGDRHEGGEPAP